MSRHIKSFLAAVLVLLFIIGISIMPLPSEADLTVSTSHNAENILNK